MIASEEHRSYRIALIAGEASGDQLGADLMKQLKTCLPSVHFFGIGGTSMQKQGLVSIGPMETLSVMGLFEVIQYLPEIITLRKKVLGLLLTNPPDIFIGIDAPDFNLGIEYKLKKKGIKTVHCVGPQVWAWRAYRIKKIRRCVDHMLVLYPFEVAFFEKHSIPSTFIGHPYTKQLVQPTTDTAKLLKKYQIDNHTNVIGLLPGSRMSEVTKLGKLLLLSAQSIFFDSRYSKDDQKKIFLIPCATQKIKDYLEKSLLDLKLNPCVRIILLDGQAPEVMSLAKLIVVASGTATLQAALHGCPMIVIYKLNHLSYMLARLLVNIDHVALPNLLSSQRIVPELIQADANVENITNQVYELLNNKARLNQIKLHFNQLLQQLSLDCSVKSAQVIKKLLN